jgi:hypothetical protein
MVRRMQISPEPYRFDSRSKPGEIMYEKPELERFGTFRELTQIGSAAGSDISAVFGLGAGCNPNTSDPDFACARS